MITVLNSKLLTPNVSETISRERFQYFLKEIPQKKLTTVIAPAGYGKTTLVAQAVRNSKWKSVWYRLGESDQDLLIFLSYLISGVKKISPAFGKNIFQAIKNVQNIETEYIKITTLLISDLEKSITDDLCFVLEDLHHIQNRPEINKTLDFLIENLPPNIHLIIISRLEPGFSLSRLRSTREILEIKTDSLAFTTEETDQLCRKLFGISLNKEDLEILQEKTEGWITGLILFYHVAKTLDRNGINKQITDLKGSSKIISSYLQENVFSNLPETIQDFLLQTSLLSLLQIDFCNNYLKIKNSREILLFLENNRFFTFVLDEEKEWFCYHHLFQEFLQKQLELKFDRLYIKKLQLNIADLYMTVNRVEEALDFCLLAEEYNYACVLFEKSINPWLEQGRHLLINSYASRIPPKYLKKHTWFIRVQALSAATAFDYRDVIKQVQIYLKNAHQDSHDNVQQVVLLKGMAHFELGEYIEAESIFKALLKQENLADPPRFEILAYSIYAAASLKKTNEAGEYHAEFLNLIEKHNIPPHKKAVYNSLVPCRKYFITGQYAKAVSFGNKVINQFNKIGLNPHTYINACYVFTSESLFHLGLFSEGLEKAQQGLEIISGAGYEKFSPPEVFLNCMAANNIGLGNIETGHNYAEKGLRIFSEKGNHVWQSRYHWLLSEVAFITGNLSLAAVHIENAVKECPNIHPKYFYYKIYLNHHRIEQGEMEAVERFLSLKTKPGCMSSDIYEFLLLEAHFYWVTGKEKMALRRFQKALSTMEEGGVYLGLLMARYWMIDLLVETVIQGKMIPYIHKTFTLPAGPWKKEGLISVSTGKNPKRRKAALDLIKYLPKAKPDSLIVNFFGNFKIMVGSEVMDSDRWKSQQAKTLFKYLTSKRGNGFIAKEVLMELLWPDKNPKASTKRFHVILTILRRTLEPDILRGVPSSYLVRDEDKYRLSFGENGWADFEKFSKQVEKGRMAKKREIAFTCFTQAESIYQGDFLAEDLYTDWCGQIRESLRNDYLFVLIWLMDYYEEEKEYALCIEVAEKFLAADPYVEDIYKRLMTFHLRNNNKNMIKQVFEKCQKQLSVGLDCSVSHETETYYLQILQQLSDSLP